MFVSEYFTERERQADGGAGDLPSPDSGATSPRHPPSSSGASAVVPEVPEVTKEPLLEDQEAMATRADTSSSSSSNGEEEEREPRA